jgi:hypothetical protein
VTLTMCTNPSGLVPTPFPAAMRPHARGCSRTGGNCDCVLQPPWQLVHLLATGHTMNTAEMCLIIRLSCVRSTLCRGSGLILGWHLLALA